MLLKKGNCSLLKSCLGRLNDTMHFSEDHHEKPTRLKKLSEMTISLFVTNANGTVQKCPGFIGQSILDAIMMSKVQGFPINLCYGLDQVIRPHHRPYAQSMGPNGGCLRCHIVLEDNWYERVLEEIGPIAHEEIGYLRLKMKDYQKNSRLSCCLPIEDWMDGITLRVIPPFLIGGDTQIA